MKHKCRYMHQTQYKIEKITQFNVIISVGVQYQHISDTGSRLTQGVSVLHRFSTTIRIETLIN
jgi:hypothetical protein